MQKNTNDQLIITILMYRYVVFVKLYIKLSPHFPWHWMILNQVQGHKDSAYISICGQLQ